MKKALIILLTSFTVFFPPIALYFSFSIENSARQAENAETAQQKLEALIKRVDRSTNENDEILREMIMLREKIAGISNNFKRFPEDAELEQIIQSELARIISKSPMPLEFNCIIIDESGVPLKSIKAGENLGLSFFTSMIRNFREIESFVSSSTGLQSPEVAVARLQVTLQSLNPYITRFLTMNVAKRISRIILRHNNHSIFLGGERLAPEHIFLFALADISAINTARQLQNTLSQIKLSDQGIAVCIDGKTVIASDFLQKNKILADTVKKHLLSHRTGGSFSAENQHYILVGPADNHKKLRFAGIMPYSSKAVFSASQNLLLAALAILSCCVCKVLLEKIAMNRGPDISIKYLLPAVFLFTLIQPAFAAAIFINEYFHTSYLNEKNRVSDRLSNDLDHIDLASLEVFRDLLNQIRRFNSIESIEKRTGLKYSQNEFELTLALLNSILQENQAVKFSSLWLTAMGRPFASISWDPDINKYDRSGIDNPITQFFHRRFQEILRETSGKSDSSSQENKKLDEELKSEFSRDFFLKILGPESFFRFRQNKEILVEFNSTFKKETMIATPLRYQGRPFGFAAWHFGNYSSRSALPQQYLSLSSLAPRIAVSGNERTMAIVGMDSKVVREKFPDLLNLGRMAHVTRTKAVSHYETDDKTIISEARPANHSYFTLCGLEHLNSFSIFKHNLIKTNLGIISIVTAGGFLMAFAGAVYFIWPLRELTKASGEIDSGNYSIRISEEHPDEFALISSSFNNMAQRLEEGSRLKNYVTDSVLKEIQSVDNQEISEKSQSGSATIIFSSIKNFSEYQKSATAEEVFELLQKHLESADEALEHGFGEIDKMIEDKIMIVFEHAENDHATKARAIENAIRLSRNFAKVSGFSTAIGINSGRIVAGIMGAANARLSRTVVGDPVNLSARLASLAGKEPDGAIIISGNCLDGVSEHCKVEKLHISQVKGKTQAVEAFKLSLKG